MRPLSLTLLPLLLVACERQPVAPDRVVAPVFAASNAAIRDEVTGTIDFVDDPADCTANPRIGEILLFTGQVNYVLRATTSSSGNVDTTLMFRYDPAVHLVGQTSGIVWNIDPTNTHGIFMVIVHGNGLVTQDAEHEFYTNAAGAHLLLHGTYHVTVDANGKVTASRDFARDCIGGQRLG